MLVSKIASRNIDKVLFKNCCIKSTSIGLFVNDGPCFESRRSTVSYKSQVGRRYDPRHGPSIYKNIHEDNTTLEGGDFDSYYRTKDDVNVEFTDSRIDRLKNPTSADLYNYHYFQSRRFARKVYAKRGRASGVDASICFPDENEVKPLQEALDKERPVSEMLAEIRAEREQFERENVAREERMREKLSEMPEMVRDWMETEAREKLRAEKIAERSQEYKERIRQHFGERISPGTPEHEKILCILIEEDMAKEKWGDDKAQAARARKEAKEAKKAKRRAEKMGEIVSETPDKSVTTESDEQSTSQLADNENEQSSLQSQASS